MDKERGIGKKNALPWYIPDDLKRFRKLTTGHAVIMGRKTFESILQRNGKPLPNRTNIVVTRDPNFKSEECVVVHSLEEALEKAKKIEKQEIFVIGGGQIFEQTIDKADRLYVTLVDAEFEADVFFPDYSGFKKVISQEKGQSGRYEYAFFILER